VPQYAQFLANHHGNRGRLKEQLGDIRAARESWGECRKLREALARAHPEVAAYRDALANLIHHLGMMELGAGNPAEALRLLESSRVIQEQLHSAQPGNPNFLTDLGGVMNDCGMALAALGRHEEAILMYQAAIKHQRRVLGRFPHFRRSQHFLSIHYQSLATSQRKLRQPANAAAAAREGLALRPNDPNYAYDIACELSLCARVVAGNDGEARAARERYAQAAINVLRKAVAAGFRNFSHMKVDADLEPLRGRSDFQIMMMDLEFPADPFSVTAATNP
jgi:tetratricopeptide (TPR) repeat protein